MFGYVTADFRTLSPEQQHRYRSYYCGLCRCIGKEFGTLPRLSLNFDSTFLAILLSSLYEPEEISGTGCCVVHPFKKNGYRVSDAVAYAAAMNIALMYYKCRDDWEDEKKLSANLFSAILKKRIPSISEQYPRQCNAIAQCIDALSLLESDNCLEPDYGAAQFGKLMEELFVWKSDRWEVPLRKAGNALGRFIYLMDAILDLPEDKKTGRYNPFNSRIDTNIRRTYQSVLQIILGECTNSFEQLPLVEDLDLLRNILYSGIWLRWQQNEPKEPNYD